MILGTVSPAFAAGQLPSDEVTVSTETAAPEYQDEVVSEDDRAVNSEQEPIDEQETVEEEVGAEIGAEEASFREEESDVERKTETESAEEEEEKPETLVGAEGQRKSVGDNVTAGFDSETGTLTFYSHGGTLFHDWYQELGIDGPSIKAITISDDSDVMYLPEDSSFLFGGEGDSGIELLNLNSINLSKVNTTNVTNMGCMFMDCDNLKTLDLSGFDTTNVTNMGAMFRWCCSLETLDLSGFDTTNVTSMEEMFSGCSSLRALNLSGFDTSNVRDVASMFSECSELRELNLSSFDLSGLQNSGAYTHVETNGSMFYYCGAYIILTPVNLQETIYLPYIFVDASGTEYNSLPKGLSQSVRLTKKGTEIPVETVIINSAKVEFQGKIQLQFSFSFPENVLADEGAYVNFEKAGTTTKKLVSEGTTDGEKISFIIPVPAPELADDIIVKVFDGRNRQLNLKSAKGTDYTENGFVYSVKTYAQNKSQNGSTDKMRALAKALDDYGTAAHNYFTDSPSILPVDGAVKAVTLDEIAPYALSTEGTKPDGLISACISAAFGSDNSLCITYEIDYSKPFGNYTFLVDGTEKSPIDEGAPGYKTVSLLVTNIAAPNLDTPHTFTITDGINTYTVTACALSYAYTSVKNGSSARQDLGKALYLYNRAADAYFGS